MLASQEFEQLMTGLGIPDQGYKLVVTARANAPVREVQSTGRNVITFVASRKMERQIATESRKVEYVAAIEHEMNPDVLEYYPQPCKCKLELIDHETGEVVAIDHTPDFLVIEKSIIRLHEWKSEAKLQSLAQKFPYRWQKIAGQWRSPQIEAHFAEMGIAYEIHSSDEVHPNKTKNWEILFDYFECHTPPCSKKMVQRLQLALKEHGSLSLMDLQHKPFEFLADDLLKAIVEGHAACDLISALISSTHEFRLYRDKALMEFDQSVLKGTSFDVNNTYAVNLVSGAQFSFDGKTLELVIIGEKELVFNILGEKSTSSLPRDWLLSALTDGTVSQISSGNQESGMLEPLLVHTQDELEKARRDSNYLSLPYDQNYTPFSERTYYRKQAAQAAAIANGGHEVLALAPHNHRKGNRTPRLSSDQYQAMEQIYSTVYKTTAAPIAKHVHRHLITHCLQIGIDAPSYPTFTTYLKSREDDSARKRRYGNRMAYQQEAFYYSLYYDTPRHGVRPFENVHIDHTLVDVELMCRRTGKPLGRPWLTLMVDSFSRRVMAFHLGFNAPDRATVLMCFRAFVQRWNRLPFMTICDNGKDLIARDVENFVSTLGCHVRRRPAGKPRVGSVMERMFGTANTQLFHNLDGNTKLTKNVRMITGTHIPQKLANWGLEDLYKLIEFWAFEHYDNQPHPALDMTPKQAFEKAIKETGERPHKLISFNQDFLVASCPTVDRGGVRTIDRQRGIKVHNFHYLSPIFDSLRLHNKKVPVRFDPNDVSRVFFQLPNGQWVEARSMQLQHLARMNLRQLKALSEEYRLVHKYKGGWDTISGQRLLEFIATLNPDDALAKELQLAGETEQLQDKLKLLEVESSPNLRPKAFGVEGLQVHAQMQISGHASKSEKRNSTPHSASTAPPQNGSVQPANENSNEESIYGDLD